MIVDNNRLSRDTHCFAKQADRVVGLMKHINEHHNIEAAFVEWYGFAVERLYGKGSIGA